MGESLGEEVRPCLKEWRSGLSLILLPLSRREIREGQSRTLWETLISEWKYTHRVWVQAFWQSHGLRFLVGLKLKLAVFAQDYMSYFHVKSTWWGTFLSLLYFGLSLAVDVICYILHLDALCYCPVCFESLSSTSFLFFWVVPLGPLFSLSVSIQGQLKNFQTLTVRPKSLLSLENIAKGC